MDLPGTLDVNTSAGANVAISRMGTFNVVGGFGPDTVSMTFTMDGRLRSRCTGQGDEAQIRLGLPASGTPAGFTEAYPGTYGDDPAGHGFFLNVALLPEPGGLWLAASALAGLALAHRCRR